MCDSLLGLGFDELWRRAAVLNSEFSLLLLARMEYQPDSRGVRNGAPQQVKRYSAQFAESVRCHAAKSFPGCCSPQAGHSRSLSLLA